MSSFENFVQCRIVTPLAASATDVALHAAVAPYRLPPETGGVLVLTDSPGNPSVVEVVRYSHRTGLALYGLQRGQEGTTARDWTGPVFCYQALMAGDFQSILDELNAGIDGKVDKAAGQSLMTDAERTKLSGIAAGAQVNTVTSVGGKTGAVALGKGDVGLGNVDNTSDAAKPVSTAQQAALNLKANLASPTFTGIPKAPTPVATDNTTQLATTAFVQAVVAALVNGAPGALNELNELAAAMGNDPNFATTMLNALALKAPLVSPALTGNPTAPTPAADDSDTSIATTAFVRAAMALFGVGASTASSLETAENWIGQRFKGWNSAAPGAPSASTAAVGFDLGYGANRRFQAAITGEQDFKFRYTIDPTVADSWRTVWHTGNLVKQASPADTTAGALMAVGAFGIGARNGATTANVGSLESGMYILQRRLNGGATPAVFTDGDYGVVFKNGYASGPAGVLSSALAYATTSQKLWWLSSLGTSIEDVTLEILTRKSILGTVSQSGGVHTGAIIERGSNANGEYIKWADGTLECWLRSVTVDCVADTDLDVTWPLPAAFNGVNAAASCTLRSPATTNTFAVHKLQGNHTSAAACTMRVRFSVTQSYLLTFHAIGRWY